MPGPFDTNTGMNWGDPYAAANTSIPGAGSPFGIPLWKLPDFKRQAAFEAMTDAGLALINASAPSPTPQSPFSMFGALAGGAAQGGRDAASRYMQRAQMAGQLRSLELQNAMYPAAIKALNTQSDYSPYGAPPAGNVPPTGGAPAGGPAGPRVGLIMGPNGGTGVTLASATPDENNIGNVRPVGGGGDSGFQTVPDFDAGVSLAVNNAKAYPDAFNGGKPMSISQIAQKWTPPSVDGNGPTSASDWTNNVAQFSGLDPNQPLDLNDPETAARFARGVHAAEKGAGAVRQFADYVPGATGQKGSGVQLAQYTPPGQSGGGSASAAPPYPVNPPDPAKYNALRVLGGQWAKQADAMYERDKQKYEAAKGLWESRFKSAQEGRAASTEARTRANAPLVQDANGNWVPNPGLLAAEAEKKRVETEAQEKARKNAIFGGEGWEKLSPEELRKRVNPEALALVEGIQSGQIRMSDIGTRTGASGIAIGKNDILALGRKLYGDNFEPNAGDIRAKWEENANDTSHQLGKTIYSVNTVFQHLDQYQDLVRAIKLGDTQTVNKINRWYSEQTGKTPFTNAQALQHALGTEIANVIKGAQLNQEEVDSALKTLDTAQSEPQLLGALGELRQAMQARVNTIKAQGKRAHVPEGRLNDIIMVPEAREALKHFDDVQAQAKAAREQNTGTVTLPAEALGALKEGHVTTFGNGQKWTLQAGKPVQVK